MGEILTDLTPSYVAICQNFSFQFYNCIENTGCLRDYLSIFPLSNFSIKPICQYLPHQNFRYTVYLLEFIYILNFIPIKFPSMVRPVRRKLKWGVLIYSIVDPRHRGLGVHPPAAVTYLTKDNPENPLLTHTAIKCN